MPIFVPKLNLNNLLHNTVTSFKDSSKPDAKNEPPKQILLSARDALLNKRELDKRESFREVVADYPIVKTQRKIIYK